MISGVDSSSLKESHLVFELNLCTHFDCRNHFRFQHTYMYLELDALWFHLSQQQKVTTNDHTVYKLVHVHLSVSTAVYIIYNMLYTQCIDRMLHHRHEFLVTWSRWCGGCICRTAKMWQCMQLASSIPQLPGFNWRIVVYINTIFSLFPNVHWKQLMPTMAENAYNS